MDSIERTEQYTFTQPAPIGNVARSELTRESSEQVHTEVHDAASHSASVNVLTGSPPTALEGPNARSAPLLPAVQESSKQRTLQKHNSEHAQLTRDVQKTMQEDLEALSLGVPARKMCQSSCAIGSRPSMEQRKSLSMRCLREPRKYRPSLENQQFSSMRHLNAVVPGVPPESLLEPNHLPTAADRQSQTGKYCTKQNKNIAGSYEAGEEITQLQRESSGVGSTPSEKIRSRPTMDPKMSSSIRCLRAQQLCKPSLDRQQFSSMRCLNASPSGQNSLHASDEIPKTGRSFSTQTVMNDDELKSAQCNTIGTRPTIDRKKSSSMRCLRAPQTCRPSLDKHQFSSTPCLKPSLTGQNARHASSGLPKSRRDLNQRSNSSRTLQRRGGTAKCVSSGGEGIVKQSSPGLDWLLDGCLLSTNTALMTRLPANDLSLGSDLWADNTFQYCEFLGAAGWSPATTRAHDFLDGKNNSSFTSSTQSSDSIEFSGVEPSDFDSVVPGGRTKKYLLKRLRKDVYKRRRELSDSMVYEANVMKGLVHSNIAKLRGTVGRPGKGFFGLLLDRPAARLDERIAEWKHRLGNCRGRFGVLGRQFQQLSSLLTERLIVAYDVARGLKYLHNHNILHLGISPTSISCDARGRAKIFDFSTAKVIYGCNVSQPQHVTADKRYAAPEVLRCGDPNTASDIYSFAILFWQIIALTEPLKSYMGDDNSQINDTIPKGRRPPMYKIRVLPKNMVAMVNSSLSENPSKRPECKEICQLLGSYVAERKGMKQDLLGDQFGFKMDKMFSFCDVGEVIVE